MAEALKHSIAFIGIDIGKNSFHVIGLDEHGAIVLRQKWSRSQMEARFANMPPSLIGMEASLQKRDVRTRSGLPPIATIMRSGFTSHASVSLGV
jgi:hypothetical protein